MGEDSNKEAEGAEGAAAGCTDSSPPKADSANQPEEKNIDYKDAYLRAAADCDNMRKESVRLRSEYAKYAAEEVVGQILPVLDNLKKALEHAPQECGQWVNGIRLIREQFEKVLAAAGVRAIEDTGVPFDPAVHDALLRRKNEGATSDTVIEIVEPGYKLHDKILRPAKVIVAE